MFTLTVKNDMFDLTGMNGKVGEEFTGKIDSEALREDEADSSTGRKTCLRASS